MIKLYLWIWHKKRLTTIANKNRLIIKYAVISHVICGGVRGVMVIVVGNGHGDTSSNPGQDWLHFT